jgi:RNA polymerase sigma-70 factor, ECF subfamily
MDMQGRRANQTRSDPAAPSVQGLAGLRDEELIELLVRREAEALGVLYDRYGRLVFAVALRITGDREVAEEVTQDVFHNAWQGAGGFRIGSGTCSAWLMGITRHRAIDATRSRRFRARAREDDLNVEYPANNENDPVYQVDQQMTREMIRSALSELPPNQRQAIELAYYGDLTGAEIAERLGEPVGTIKTRMRLGMQKLRALFSQRGERPLDDGA